MIKKGNCNTESVPTICWSSRQVTVLCYAKHKGEENVLLSDQKYVKKLSKYPKSLLSSKHVVYLFRDTSSINLLTAACETLLKNKTVVIQGFVDTLSRPGQLRNYLWNVRRLVSNGTWLQRLGEEHCALVKSLSRISECGDNSEARL